MITQHSGSSETQLHPFSSHVPGDPGDLAGREVEVARIRKALLAPSARLLVHGAPRAGKSWALQGAQLQAWARGGTVVAADLSTASAVTDAVNQVLAAAARSLGHRWTEAVGEVAGRLGVPVRLEPAEEGEVVLPSLDPNLRQRPPGEQWPALRQVLAALDRMASRRSRILGVVLDEFQTVLGFGGRDSEAGFRDAIQEHRNLSVVLAGSGPVPVEMLQEGRPLHGVFGVLRMEPVAPDALAAWIDERMEGAGRPRPGVGESCWEVAGPRTGDVVRLAHRCFEQGGQGRQEAPEELVERAFGAVVRAQDQPLRTFWRGLTPYQQNVLRAVAGSERGLTTSETLARFTLGHSGSAANAARSLVEAGHLVRADEASGYAFDSPFLRGWVVRHALPDVGIHRAVGWSPRD